MSHHFSHSKIYYDLQKLYKTYWNLHLNFPKTFRYTTGESILKELTEAIKIVVSVNIYSKMKNQVVDKQPHYLLASASAILDTIEALFLLAWEMAFLSHGALSILTELLGNIQRQLVGWRKWFLTHA